MLKYNDEKQEKRKENKKEKIKNRIKIAEMKKRKEEKQSIMDDDQKVGCYIESIPYKRRKKW